LKKIAILQSNYIPWKGYFDLIAAVDEFILYDDVQFTKSDWRNRNKIKTPKGVEWLTIPVGQNINRLIRDVELPRTDWQSKHWKTLEANYQRALHFEEIATMLKPVYLEPHARLTDLNRSFIEKICTYLAIPTAIRYSWDYEAATGRNERLVDLCLQAGANQYISGPSARGYLDVEMFNKNNIEVRWFEYEGYPPYAQLWGAFTHQVSIIDLLFNCGGNASQYMKCGRR